MRQSPLIQLLLIFLVVAGGVGTAESDDFAGEKESKRTVTASATVSTRVEAVSHIESGQKGVPEAQPTIGEIAYVDLPGGSAYLRSLTVICHNIFPESDQYSRAFYGKVANALHMTTRKSVIRRGLGFSEGDLVSRDDLEAAIRKLRTYYFLHSDVEMNICPVADSLDITIETRDIWTTRPLLEFRKSGGLVTWSAGLEEYNLFGGGKGLGFTIGHDEYQPYYGGWLRDPQFCNSNLLCRLVVFSGKSLKMQRLDFEHPFNHVAVNWGLMWASRNYEGTFVDRRGGLDGPEWQQEKWKISAAGGPKIFNSGKNALWLKPAVYMISERYHSPKPGTADAALAATLSPILARDIRATGVELHFMHENYSQRAGINSFYRREDFNLGSDFRLRAGYSPEAFGATRDGLFFKLQMIQGLSLGKRQMLNFSLWSEVEYISDRFEDLRVISQLWYFRNLSRQQTLAMHIKSSWSHRILPQKIFTMGVENSLRGFEAYCFSGERTVIANIEDRLVVFDNIAGLMTLGLAGFIDGGVAWNSDERKQARPHIAAGIGLRILGSRTRGTLVTRIDLGFPIAGRNDDDGPVLSVAAGQAF